MNNQNVIARFVRLSIYIAISYCSVSTALAQSSEDERAALEEAERQRGIARTFAANARQIEAYDLDGRRLGTIGEPAIYTFLKYSPDLSMVATVRIDLQQELSDIWILDAGTGDATQLTHSDPRQFVQTPVWSPDGSRIAYVALRGSRFGIYLRRPDGEGEAELVYDHEGGPINLGDWSLDGRYLAFSASDLGGGRLYTIDLEGDREPVLVFESGQPANVPRFSPDRRYISYFSNETGRNEYYVIRATAQQGGERERWQLTTDGAFGIGQWDSDDAKYYYLGAERRVMAVDVDTSGDFEFGNAQRIFTVPDAIPAAGGGGIVTLSRTGDRVIMALPPEQEPLQIVTLDREGNEISRIGEPGRYFQPAYSPDGSKLVTLRQDVETGSVDIWTFDVATGVGRQVTATVNIAEASPVWMPDGEHIAYSYFDDDYGQIYRKRADGSGEAEFLFRFTPGAFITLMDASHDGQYLVLESFGYVVSVPLSGDDPYAREGIDLLREEFEVSVPRLSPDGRFVAYTYNESGRPEVYISAFDPTTGMAGSSQRLQVSDGGAIGGISWREDGGELYYMTENLATEEELNDGMVMAVAVTTTPALRTGEPRELFRLTVPAAGDPSQWQNASPDGQQFVFALPAE
jgi:Tol biopolymer transport system component